MVTWRENVIRHLTTITPDGNSTVYALDDSRFVSVMLTVSTSIMEYFLIANHVE